MKKNSGFAYVEYAKKSVQNCQRDLRKRLEDLKVVERLIILNHGGADHEENAPQI